MIISISNLPNLKYNNFQLESYVIFNTKRKIYNNLYYKGMFIVKNIYYNIMNELDKIFSILIKSETLLLIDLSADCISINAINFLLFFDICELKTVQEVPTG